VSGLQGSLRVVLNNEDELLLSEDGIYAFATLLPWDTSYALTITEAPQPGSSRAAAANRIPVCRGRKLRVNMKHLL